MTLSTFTFAGTGNGAVQIEPYADDILLPAAPAQTGQERSAFVLIGNDSGDVADVSDYRMGEVHPTGDYVAASLTSGRVLCAARWGSEYLIQRVPGSFPGNSLQIPAHQAGVPFRGFGVCFDGQRGGWAIRISPSYSGASVFPQWWHPSVSLAGAWLVDAAVNPELRFYGVNYSSQPVVLPHTEVQLSATTKMLVATAEGLDYAPYRHARLRCYDLNTGDIVSDGCALVGTSREG